MATIPPTAERRRMDCTQDFKAISAILLPQPGPTPLQRASLGRPGDDWTGITDAKERRRRQNRVHQRAYRKRHANPASSSTSTSELPPRDSHSPAEPSPSPPMSDQGWTRVSGSRNGTPAPLPLPLVVKLNTCNAFMHNARVLSIDIDLICDANLSSPFAQRCPAIIEASWPVALHPTELQKTARHNSWIDVLPLPRLRDNLIRACPLINEMEIGSDIMNVGDFIDDKATLVVWSNPSDPRSWEASTAFLRKWGYLLKGCQELIEATNYWRNKRGEHILRVDVS